MTNLTANGVGYDPDGWHDAGYEASYRFRRFASADSPLEQANQLVELSNAITILESWLPGHDVEADTMPWDRDQEPADFTIDLDEHAAIGALLAGLITGLGLSPEAATETTDRMLRSLTETQLNRLTDAATSSLTGS